MILVPMNSAGVTVVRPLPIFGFYGMPDRAAEVNFENARPGVQHALGRRPRLLRSLKGVWAQGAFTIA